MKKRIWILLFCGMLLIAGWILRMKFSNNAQLPEQETLNTEITEQEILPSADESLPEETEPATQPALSEEELEDRRQWLKGKYVSILGDSISTYEGISNGSAVNTTIESYNAWYNGDWKGAFESEESTYWGSVISKYQMELLVNNSCGGNRLSQAGGTGVYADAGYKRVEHLAANTGELDGIQPDIILIHMGINDFNGNVMLGFPVDESCDWVRYEGEYVMPATFTEAYIITLEKAMELYPQAQIFVFTLLPSHYNTYWDGLDAYNARIRELAAYYEGVVLVDIAAESGITPENYMRYTFDGTHPNSLGMDAIARVLERAMLNNISLDEHEVETVG